MAVLAANAYRTQRNGQPEWAVVPYEVNRRLVEEAEMLAGTQAYDEAKRGLEAGEKVPAAHVAYVLIDGANPIRVWREYRGITQQEVAEAVGISVPYLSQLETGKRRGSTEVLAASTRYLGGSLDDIAEP